MSSAFSNCNTWPPMKVIDFLSNDLFDLSLKKTNLDHDGLLCACSTPIKKSRSDLSMRQQHSAVSWRHLLFFPPLGPAPPPPSPRPSLLCHTNSWQERDRTWGRNEANGRGRAWREGESQCDKACEQAGVNTRVTCPAGDSCVTDASRHAGLDSLTPLSVQR